MKVFFKTNLFSYGFYISKFNNLKVVHNLYSQCLTQTLSKTTFFMGMEGVLVSLDGPFNSIKGTEVINLTRFLAI